METIKYAAFAALHKQSASAHATRLRVDLTQMFFNAEALNFLLYERDDFVFILLIYDSV